jgi:hypothetical protein
VRVLAFEIGDIVTVDIEPGKALAVNFTTSNTYSEGMTVHWRRNNDSWAQLPKGTLIPLPGLVTDTENTTYSFFPLTTTYKFNSTGHFHDFPAISWNKGNLRFTKLNLAGN